MPCSVTAPPMRVTLLLLLLLRLQPAMMPDSTASFAEGLQRNPAGHTFTLRVESLLLSCAELDLYTVQVQPAVESSAVAPGHRSPTAAGDRGGAASDAGAVRP